MRTARRLLARLIAAVIGLGALTGCGLELKDVPLPGLVGGPTYGITAEFSDALNLPVDAPVKLEGVTVGQVTAVRAGDYVAEVDLAISDDVVLRSSSRAAIRLTSPMGTAYVQLVPGKKGRPMRDGAIIAADRTHEAPDVTDLLTALSTVVTGGSFGDISTIIGELNVALTGNAPQVRRLLRRLDTVVTDLNDRFPTVDRLTRSLDRLSRRLAGDVPTISASVEELAGLVESLERQRGTMMRTLGSLRRFEATATPFSEEVSGDLRATLRSARTVLRTLVDNQRDIDGVMAGLIAFATGSDEATPGDFANFDLTFLLDLRALLALQSGDEPAPPQGGARR